jgi:hypothetical protein
LEEVLTCRETDKYLIDWLTMVSYWCYSVFGCLHRVVMEDNTGVSEAHTASIFRVEACRLVNCLLKFYWPLKGPSEHFRIRCSYWLGRGTNSHSIPLPPFLFKTTESYIHSYSPTYTLRPWRWRQHIPLKRRNLRPTARRHNNPRTELTPALLRLLFSTTFFRTTVLYTTRICFMPSVQCGNRAEKCRILGASRRERHSLGTNWVR